MAASLRDEDLQPAMLSCIALSGAAIQTFSDRLKKNALLRLKVDYDCKLLFTESGMLCREKRYALMFAGDPRYRTQPVL